MIFRILQIVMVVFFVLFTNARATESAGLVPDQAMVDVVKIAYAISVLKPNLEEPKYVEYAIGVYRAAKRYNVSPSLLMSIAFQESSFRESLPEGQAGEVGITQVLKKWLGNPKFRKEFSFATTRSMKKPSKSFLYSAWILKELKKARTKGSLPYWSYYNATRYGSRVEYFAKINRHLAKIRRNLGRIDRATQLASISLTSNENFHIPFVDNIAAKSKPAHPRAYSSLSNRKVSHFATQDAVASASTTPQSLLLKGTESVPGT